MIIGFWVVWLKFIKMRFSVAYHHILPCVVLIVCMPEVPFLNLATFSLEERYMYFCPPIFAPLVLKASCPDWLKLVIKVLRSAGSTYIWQCKKTCVNRYWYWQRSKEFINLNTNCNHKFFNYKYLWIKL